MNSLRSPHTPLAALLRRRDLPNPSIIRHARSIRIGLRHSQPIKLAQHTRSRASQRARICKSVRHTSPAQRILASAIAARGCIQRRSEVLLRGGDVVECAAFDQDVGVLAFEGVAGVVGPVVVDGVEEGGAADFGGAAGGVVDVVAFEGDLVVGADEVEGLQSEAQKVSKCLSKGDGF